MNVGNPKPCSVCSAIFQSDKAELFDQAIPMDETILFESETPLELLPGSCPICAIIRFDSLIRQEQYIKVRYSLETEEDGERYLVLYFYTHDRYSHRRHLLIIAANGKTLVLATNKS